MGIGKFILNEIGYIIYWLIPYIFDLDILGFIDGTLGVPTSWLPLVEPIDIKELSQKQKIVLIALMVLPYLDLELIKALRLHKRSKLFRYTAKETKNLKRAKKLGKKRAEKKKEQLKNQAKTQKSNKKPQKKKNKSSLRRNKDRLTRREPIQSGGKNDSFISISSFPFKKIGKVFGGLIGILILLVVFVSVFGGSGYGMLLNDLGGGAAAEVRATTPLDEVSYQFRQLSGVVACFGDAGCLRELRLNSTRKPGSEDVGKPFKLRILEPSVEGEKDMRFSEPDKEIPVGFTVRNARQGVKGIPARNVEYRIKVSDTGILNDKTACQTEWKKLNKFGDSDIENNNVILPGESASPLNYRPGDRLELWECGLMNPVSSGSYRVEVQVKYDYFAISFLQLDAKAYTEVERIDRTRSKTPDTPVETFIRSDNPITFDDREGRYVPRPFNLRMGIHSDDEGSFRVKAEELRLTDSSLTTETENCQELVKVEGSENRYKLNETIIDRFRYRQEEENEWFSSRTGAPAASCTFELENPNEVSETGETVTMTAEANYTVRSGDKATNFAIRNSACSTNNCPFIVPLNSEWLTESRVAELDLDEDSPTDYKGNTNWEKGDYWKKEYAVCNRPQDAVDGCSWVESFNLDDRRELSGIDEDKRLIEEGKIAINMTGNYNGDNFVTCHGEDAGEESHQVIGVERDNTTEDAFLDSTSAFNYTESGTWKFVDDYDQGECNAG